MTVLVVDDERFVRKFIRTILVRHGYETLEAGDGVEALECASQHACDLVITDFTMPSMNGRELTTQLQERNYPARYLLMSAHMPENAGSGIAFLAKPFTPAQLIDAIEKLKKQTPSPVELKFAAKQAKQEWLDTIAEQKEIISEVPSQIPGPDGTLRIQKAGSKRKAAYEKYLEALKAYRISLRQNAAGSGEPDDPRPEL
jgi:CheY-like chemotaxis protein